MRLDVEWLAAQGEDGSLLQLIDTAFPSDGPDAVAVAVSGGGDSLALLHVAWRWSRVAGVPIEAVTVDHNLRPDAAAEARSVAAFCDIRAIPHTVLDWDGGRAKGNLMAAARAARYALIADWAKSRNIRGVLLGHTVDDIAETFLMRLARGAGVDGLSLMETRFERNGLQWARPFWQVARTDLREYLRRHDIGWTEDPTNADPAFDRTRARAALAAMSDLGIDADRLKDVALNLYSARGALEHYTIKEARRVVEIDRGDVVLKLHPNPPVPPEIDRRLRSAAIQWVGGSVYPPRSSGMAALDVPLASVGKHTLGGCLVAKERNGESLRISRETAAVQDLRTPTTSTWDGRWTLDGPHSPDLHIAALGQGITRCPNWRDAGLPRASLLSSPAVWRGAELVSAPLAGEQNGWTARIVVPFTDWLVSR